MSDNKNKELNNTSLSSSASNGRGGLAIYWNAFKTFFKIGAFTLGGGYAMISIIENEVVDKQRWIGTVHESGNSVAIVPYHSFHRTFLPPVHGHSVGGSHVSWHSPCRRRAHCRANIHACEKRKD